MDKCGYGHSFIWAIICSQPQRSPPVRQCELLVLYDMQREMNGTHKDEAEQNRAIALKDRARCNQAQSPSHNHWLHQRPIESVRCAAGHSDRTVGNLTLSDEVDAFRVTVAKCQRNRSALTAPLAKARSGADGLLTRLQVGTLLQ
jgi:hypothetical protein